MTISPAHSYIEQRLLETAKTDKLREAEELLEQGADVDCRGAHDGQTPLHVAALRGQLEMAHLLLKWGASRELFDNQGDTPMLLAARHGHGGLVRLFILRGFNIDLANEKTGETPLMAASHDEALAAAAHLMEANADTDAQDGIGETALMKAAQNNQPGAVEALIGGFADIYMKDNHGCMAFDLAKEVKAVAACIALYPHHEAGDREKTYNMAQRLRPTKKFSVGKPLQFRKPGDSA